MDTQILEDIGLSPTEIKVFITLLEKGELKAGKIIEKSKLQSSSVYNAVNSLISKGLVSYIKKSEVKYYRSADPEAILDYLESKKLSYLKILPELKEKQHHQEEEEVEFFKSYKGIKVLYSRLFKDAKKGDIYRTFNVEDMEEYKNASERVFRFVKELAKGKKVIEKGIFNEKSRKKPKKSSLIQKRYTNEHLPPNTSILDNKVAIISWKEEPSGILIHSKNLAEKYIEFFEQMWSVSKK